ncbi:uncharacterized protein PHACADRAFT_166995 [Phanerochaete carnosa HHB-10118-sp]|uniref:RING-type E3 ubiquitin transferase n=1 Tax=Phanerochaete carnosa (strain HHB-10118-sp) TaxID=650164 RepID=K5VEN2_PHACS|nr:uncharacterized protein PHACADRAFT_166995 [Phanerochaete carnosa HHB-10118-sp]EKM49628.1 hypothetical protein PHACADRAFT_166995 [Phanerochaete carnosa HHB-10118-sp]
MSSPEADLRSHIDDSPPSTMDGSPSSAAETQSSTLSEQPSHSRGLSPGSIDVLGTLLSVAAAATAASLFSPGLSLNNPNSPPSSNPSSSPPSPQTSTRPLSPTPTAGLGALGGLGGLSGLGLNSNPTSAPQDSRDRIRNVWDSIRERVGLNSRSNGPSDRPAEDGPGATTPGGGNPRMRPGEMMLAEMARALNAGLGLAHNPSNSTSERRQESASPPHAFFPSITDSGGSPPEGSFERFLANLQNDLRTILGEEPSTVASQGADVSVEPPSGSPDVVEQAQAQEPERVASRPPTPIPLLGNDDDPPPLADDADSDSDESFHDADGAGSDSSDHQTITDQPLRTPTPIPDSIAQDHPAHTEPAENRRRERPAINLWRIYRFDPIPATHAQTQATVSPRPGGNSFASVHETGLGASTSGPPPLTRSSSSESESGPDSPRSPLTDIPTLNAHASVVVPVIVVGLQSVDVVESDEPEDEATHIHPRPSSPTDQAAPAEDGSSRPTTPRGRRWPSRAANALRTWRPGRRGSQARRNADGSGSRTFLIYVIGGYYPPNHHMVTGSDNLDSYEALWELAELLGQVKPPTATREDIDKSGLQIVKASELPRLEEEGRVASNCVDRCLVCLDDYEPDTELRLMTCRHAFHKDCVDKWLQIGRNNCPACRTKGVNVPGDPPSTTPEAAIA